ncbi:MAG: hypothetical protein JO111_00690 [Caulobacteraceae bacterium]|nr:hypothetical protein [Caulobacteraceae bacterium]
MADVLQSVPVLAFLPVIPAFFVARHAFEGAAVFVIFIQIIWNIVFRVVSGLRICAETGKPPPAPFPSAPQTADFFNTFHPEPTFARSAFWPVPGFYGAGRRAAHDPSSHTLSLGAERLDPIPFQSQSQPEPEPAPVLSFRHPCPRLDQRLGHVSDEGAPLGT